MKLTFLLPALLVIGTVSGSALGAPSEENSKSYKRDHDKRVEHKRDERKHEKRVEYKRDERRHEKKKRIEYKQDKREQRKYENRKRAYVKSNHHKVVTYRPGRLINHLPRNSASIRFNGISFTFNDGIYYRKAKSGYRSVIPPRGLRIRSLPKHYSRIRHHNTTYYTYQNVYYVADNDGYTVVDTPNIQLNKAIKIGNANDYSLGETYDSLPSSAEAVTINSKQYFKYNDIYFLPQISGDEIKYLAISLG
ncbi:DUF6515 family protein [Pseudoalteromonas sp. TB64]|uniref:DUF6515 family protein n=1 Tax=Pseudoalteromonas sp. TB64 TaxID=1938600 RepID=UPI000403A4D1|nr:DUF6515 family protein [Pseudoalteromonas sp. TB64]